MFRQFRVEFSSSQPPSPERLEQARRMLERAVACLWTRQPWLSRWRTFYACLASQLEIRAEWEPLARVFLPDGSVIETGRHGWTDGRSIVINAAAVVDQGEALKLLLHELEHIARLHLLRLGSRDLRLWNIATDLVINAQIAAELGSPPAGGLFDPCIVRRPERRLSPGLSRRISPRRPRSADASAEAADGLEPDPETDATGLPLAPVPLEEVMAEEWVYDRLVARQMLTGDPLTGYSARQNVRAEGEKVEFDFDDLLSRIRQIDGLSGIRQIDGGSGNSKDEATTLWPPISDDFLWESRMPSGQFHADLVPWRSDGHEKRVLEGAVLTASVLANQLEAGCVPGFVQEFLRIRLKDVPPWSRALRRWLDEFDREHRSWTRFHRRSAFLPCPAPGRRRTPGLVGVVLDTSGSMFSSVLADVLGELRALALAMRLPLVVWQADTQVYGPVVYERPEELPLEWRLWGRGGTMMSDAAEAVRERGLRLTLWITDGMWFDKPKLPDTRNVAILVGGGRPPAGVVFDEIIKVDSDA